MIIYKVGSANVLSVAVKKTSVYILKKFGTGIGGNTAKQLGNVTRGLIVKYGDECLPFIKATGHDGIRILQTAGKNGSKILHLYKRFGDDVLWLMNPERLKLILKHGDEAAGAMLRHPGIADRLIRRQGKEAISVLNKLSRKNTQRLAILSNDSFMRGEKAIKVFSILKREGNVAMDFIWKHKKSLAIATVLATFLKDPESYFKGIKTLLVDPVVEPVKIAVRRIDWNLMLVLLMLMVFVLFGLKKYIKFKKKKSIQTLH